MEGPCDMCSIDPYWFMISGRLYCQFICMHIYIYIIIYIYLYTYMYLYYIYKEREREGLDIVIIYVTKYVNQPVFHGMRVLNTAD